MLYRGGGSSWIMLPDKLELRLIRNSECGIRNYCYRFAVDMIVCDVKYCPVIDFNFAIMQFLFILHKNPDPSPKGTHSIPNSAFRIPNFQSSARCRWQISICPNRCAKSRFSCSRIAPDIVFRLLREHFCVNTAVQGNKLVVSAAFLYRIISKNHDPVAELAA